MLHAPAFSRPVSLSGSETMTSRQILYWLRHMRQMSAAGALTGCVKRFRGNRVYVQVLEEHLKHAMAAQGDSSSKAIHDGVVRAALGMLPAHTLDAEGDCFVSHQKAYSRTGCGAEFS